MAGGAGGGNDNGKGGTGYKAQAGGAGGSSSNGGGGGGGGASGYFSFSAGGELAGSGGVGGGTGGGAGGSGDTYFEIEAGGGTYGGSGLAGGAGTGAGGGGGGGGGVAGYFGAGTDLATSTYSVTGGTGGAGGAGGPTDQNGGGGGGGAGGYGAIVTGTKVTIAAPDTGGAGGAGGAAGVLPAISSGGGQGGGGGTGLRAKATGATITNNSTITGGAGGAGQDGGAGGAGLYASGSGDIISNAGSITGGQGGTGALFGVGGIGGAGVALTGAGANLSNQASSTITGGAGGKSGVDGGSGGAGVSFASGGVLSNAGRIAAGASGYSTQSLPTNGVAGVSGAGLTIVDTGSIAGGAGGGSGANGTGNQGDAIAFTGGTNFLSLGTNSGLKGTSGLTGAIDIQALKSTLAFDQSVGNGPTIVNVSAPIIGMGAIVKNSSSTLTLSGADTFSGGTTIDAGTLQLATAGSAGSGAIMFAPASDGTATLALEHAAQPSQNGTFANTLANFGVGARLDIEGVPYVTPANGQPTPQTYDATAGTLEFDESGTSENFTLSGVAAGEKFFAESDGSGGSLVFATVCYASGTAIRTARGDVAVEDLAVGDLAVTASGALRPIRWLGHRAVDCRHHPRPEKVRPYRIRAGAFGTGLPYRDLFVSPAHALCVDDLLIPVRALRHGDLVAQVATDAVTYWHVELDTHDILVANGLPAESYLDLDNRASFDNADGPRLLHPDFEPKSTADYCRRYVESGSELSRVRATLFGDGSAAAEPAPAEGLHLVADGVVLVPHLSGDVATFVVPAATRELRLCSPTFRPAGDARSLGIALTGLSVDAGAGAHAVALDDPALFAGLHDVEGSADGCWRWTDGAAHLAPELWADAVDTFVLGVVGAAMQADVPVDSMAA